MQVQNRDHFMQLVKGGVNDFFISFGVACSSKDIFFDKKNNRVHIMNNIDGSVHYLTEKQIFEKNRSNIAKAISQGALFFRV